MITTVSFTRCWTRLRAEALAWALAGLAVLAPSLWPTLARADAASGIEITALRAERSDEGVLLNASLRIALPPPVEDALEKGIPMVFVAEAAVSRERWYWYDKVVARAAKHMRLSYHPLTRRWRLLVTEGPAGNAGLALGQSFDTLTDALAVVQRIAQWRVAPAGEAEADGKHVVEFRFRLDVSQLPRPFQIGAVGQAEWNLAASRTLRLAEAAR